MIKGNQLKVILWNKEVGTLFWDRAARTGRFFYSPDFLRSGWDITPITCPLSSPEAKFAISGIKATAAEPESMLYQGLPPFIADSLPDSWGNKLFDEWFTEQGLKDSDKTPLAKLAFIGHHAMGALEFEPVLTQPRDSRGSVDLEALFRKAEAIRNEPAASGTFVIGDLAGLGTSPGGRQNKIIVAKGPDGLLYSGRDYAGRDGFRQCIIKFNTPEYSLSEIEKTYYELARLCGITMMPSGLVESGGIKHFITERFDRTPEGKVFTQTLAAVNPSARTCEALFATARRLGLPASDIRELFTRTAFNFLLNNTDDHTKNVSFTMDREGLWRLAPAYDMTFIISKTANRPESVHCMSLAGKTSGVGVDDLKLFALKNDIKGADNIIDSVISAARQLHDMAEKNGVAGYFVDMMTQRVDSLCGLTKGMSRDERSFIFSGRNENTHHVIKNVRFEKTDGGNIHLYANIDGAVRRYVITPKKPLFRELIETGFSRISDARLQEIIALCFFGRKAGISQGKKTDSK